MTLAFDFYFSILYTISMVTIHFAKGNSNLLYPPGVWGIELAGLLALFASQMARISLGFEANRLESHGYALVFFGVTITTIVVTSQYMFLTTYVLTVEILLGSVLFVMNILEIFLSIAAFLIFRSKSDKHVSI